MDRLIISPDGFRQQAKPTKEKLERMAMEATSFAEQGALIITQLLVERKAMDILVDDLIAGKEGAAVAIIAARVERIPGTEE